LEIEEAKRNKTWKKGKKPKPALSSYKVNERAISNIIKMPGISSYAKLPAMTSRSPPLQFLDNSGSQEGEI
jgi:hypothetical protein